MPGLGLERGLGDNLVIAPYATALAAMIAPHEACANLERLERLGYLSPAGFYDAVDYTPDRRPAGDCPAPCRIVMAHHSGMTLLAFAAILLDGPMRRRFLAHAPCNAHGLLLQERLPQDIRPVDLQTLDTVSRAPRKGKTVDVKLSVFDTPQTELPEVQLLSSGTYHVMLTSAGSGMSRWRDVALTGRRDGDPGGHCGQFCYLRDLQRGVYWSNTYQPACREAEKYEAVFSPGRAEYRCIQEGIDARTQVAVSPEYDVEIRRLTVTNLSRSPRTLDTTTYAEVLLKPLERECPTGVGNDDCIHAELLPEAKAILCSRRSPLSDDSSPWMFHLLHVEGNTLGRPSFETSRRRFLGPERSLEQPGAMRQDALSGTAGGVDDPMVGVRQQFLLAAEESAVINIVTGAAGSRADALAAVGRFRDPRLIERALDLSRTYSQLWLRRLGMTEADARFYTRLASPLLFCDGCLDRVRRDITRQSRGIEGLAALGIHPGRPIVLACVSDPERLGAVEQLLGAHAYWRSQGLETSLVVWLEGNVKCATTSTSGSSR